MQGGGLEEAVSQTIAETVKNRVLFRAGKRGSDSTGFVSAYPKLKVRNYQRGQQLTTEPQLLFAFCS